MKSIVICYPRRQHICTSSTCMQHSPYYCSSSYKAGIYRGVWNCVHVLFQINKCRNSILFLLLSIWNSSPQRVELELPLAVKSFKRKTYKSGNFTLQSSKDKWMYIIPVCRMPDCQVFHNSPRALHLSEDMAPWPSRIHQVALFGDDTFPCQLHVGLELETHLTHTLLYVVIMSTFLDLHYPYHAKHSVFINLFLLSATICSHSALFFPSESKRTLRAVPEATFSFSFPTCQLLSSISRTPPLLLASFHPTRQHIIKQNLITKCNTQDLCQNVYLPVHSYKVEFEPSLPQLMYLHEFVRNYLK